MHRVRVQRRPPHTHLFNPGTRDEFGFYTTPTCTRDLSLPSSNPLSLFVPSSHASMSFSNRRDLCDWAPRVPPYRSQPSRAHHINRAHVRGLGLTAGRYRRLRRAFPLDSRMHPHVYIHTPKSTTGAFTRAFPFDSRMRPHATCAPKVRGRSPTPLPECALMLPAQPHPSRGWASSTRSTAPAPSPPPSCVCGAPSHSTPDCALMLPAHPN